MDEDSETLWQWRIKTADNRYAKLLGWRMTEQRARQWAQRKGVDIERVPGSAVVRDAEKPIAGEQEPIVQGGGDGRVADCGR